MERCGGSFDRTISLPIEIDSDGVKAECRDGILALFLPRAEHHKPRSISISNVRGLGRQSCPANRLKCSRRRSWYAKGEKTVPTRYYITSTDIFETDDALVIVKEVPGVDRKNVDVKARER